MTIDPQPDLMFRCLHIRSSDPSVIRRGRILIQMVTVVALVLAARAVGWGISTLRTPGHLPPEGWLPFLALLAALGLSLTTIPIAKSGRVRAAGRFWFAGITVIILIRGLPIHNTWELQTAALLLLIVAGGLLFQPFWGIGIALLVSLYEIGMALLPEADFNPDRLAALVGINLVLGGVTWITAASLQASLRESDRLRQEAEMLRDMALELSRRYSDLIAGSFLLFDRPLSLIRSYIDQLSQSESYALSPQGRESIQMIQHASQQLAQLTRDLATAPCTHQPVQQLREIHFSPSRLVLDALDGLTGDLRCGRFEVDCTVDPALPDQLEGNSVTLRHALHGVLEHLLAGMGEVGRVTCALGRAGADRWQICLESESAAPSSDLLRRIAGRLRHPAPPPPADLHLRLASDLIQSMGGEVTVRADSGRWAARIELPLTLAQGSPVSALRGPSLQRRD